MFRTVLAAAQRCLGEAATSQGVDLRQSLAGTSSSVTLWDPALRAVYHRTETSSLTGTMELPGMGMSGIPIMFENRTMMQLAGQQ